MKIGTIDTSVRKYTAVQAGTFAAALEKLSAVLEDEHALYGVREFSIYASEFYPASRLGPVLTSERFLGAREVSAAALQEEAHSISLRAEWVRSTASLHPQDATRLEVGP